MKGIERYFHVILFIILYKVVLGLKSVDENLRCDHSNETFFTSVLLCFQVVLSHWCPLLSVRFGLSIGRNEVKRLWDTLITDQRGSLEYWQFVRTFGYSLDSAGSFIPF